MLTFASMSTKNFKILCDKIEQGELSPVYFLYGAESYFIDELADLITAKALNEEERAFNETIFYGLSTESGNILDQAKRFPMMAQRQLVVIREAHMLKSFEPLVSLLTKPIPTTILVFLFKQETLPKTKVRFKDWDQSVEVFESKPLYENQLKPWLADYLKAQEWSIEPKAAQILIEYLGTDLEKLVNALNKLNIKSQGKTITTAMVEEVVGVNRSYNVFELQEALGQRDIKSFMKIGEVLSGDVKNNPFVLVLASMFNYISKLYSIKGTSGELNEVKRVIQIRSEFIVKKYVVAANKYTYEELEHMLHALRDADLKYKGITTYGIKDKECFFEMLLALVRA